VTALLNIIYTKTLNVPHIGAPCDQWPDARQTLDEGPIRTCVTGQEYRATLPSVLPSVNTLPYGGTGGSLQLRAAEYRFLCIIKYITKPQFHFPAM